MRMFVVMIAVLLVPATYAAAQTCNGEARYTCESNGGTWNSGNCTCS